MLRCLVFILGLALTVSSMSQNPVVNPQVLRKTFEGVKPYADLSNAFYSIKGLSLLDNKLSLDAQEVKEVCDFAKAKAEKSSLESIYYATSLASLVPNCQLDSSVYQSTLSKGDASTSVADLYYYVNIAENLKLKFDSKKVAASLTNALKTDSSIVNQGFSLHIASKLADGSKAFYDSIEDILDQADEVDGSALQFEGGVGTTSIVLEGILVLSEKLNKLHDKFTNERLEKFLNYVISKRYPTNIKSAYFLMKATNKLSDNKFTVPLFLNRLSPLAISATSSNLLVSVTDILGRPVKEKIDLEAVSATSTDGKSSLFSGKKAFVAKSSDRTAFDVKLTDNAKLNAGFYAVTIGLKADKKYFLSKKSVQVKVTTKITVTDVAMAVSDRDSTQPQLDKFEGKAKKLEADKLSKFTMRFGVKDQTKGSLVEAHQAFLKFTDVKTGREIIYLAETGLTKSYKVEVDFQVNAKNFNYQSGTYSVDLVVSDSLFENPTILKLSEISVNFGDEVSASTDKSLLYSKKPEIKHVFRQPEKTPSKSISSLFALLCFTPLFLVFVLWGKIGFNFSKYEFSLAGVIFHVSLALIFGLFYCYWVEINMFVTIRYLGILGLVAIFSGNRLLRELAARK